MRSSSGAAVGDLAFWRTGWRLRPRDGAPAHGPASRSLTASAARARDLPQGPRAASKTWAWERATETDLRTFRSVGPEAGEHGSAISRPARSRLEARSNDETSSA